jgi:hypothetical protein
MSEVAPLIMPAPALLSSIRMPMRELLLPIFFQ